MEAVRGRYALWRRVKGWLVSLSPLQLAAISWATNTLLLCVAVVFLTLSFAASEQGEASRPTANARLVELNVLAFPDQGSLLLALGDRLKITFFEQIEPTVEEASSGQTHVPSIVERVELTGEFTVQLDGNMFLPLLGPTSAAGRPLLEVQGQMRSAFQKIFGRDARVSVVILEREPIYVVGAVARPGTYKYSPGMIVLHAVALSGGLEGGIGSDVSQFLESTREGERQQKATERLKKLLARSAVLKAERTKGTPELTPRLMSLAGEAQAKALIAELTSIRKLTTESRLAQVRAFDATIDAARRELESLHARIAHIEANIQSRAERVNTVRSLHSRGSTSGHGLAQVRSELSDVQERLQEALANISRTEQRIAQAQHERSKLAMEAQVEVERDLYATVSEIAQEELTLATSRHVVNSISRPHTWRDGKPDLSFDIVRRTAEGVKEFAASETTVLEPGDLIRIRS